MNGLHDMGGMGGFGPVQVEEGEPVFHHPWERRVFGLVAGSAARRLAGSTDAFRFAIERMPPAHYLQAPYYERWLTALATLLVEKGVITREELVRRAGGSFPLSQPVPPLRLPTATRSQAPRFGVGDSVVVRNEHPGGHTRCPRYVRGKRGTVVRVDGAFRLPDVAAHREVPCAEPAYSVRFAARELWGKDAAATESVHVDLWESYLEPPLEP
jgi:nitrile hydratase subunit beta